MKLMREKGAGERLLVPVPMFHITGMTVLMLTPLSMGVTIYPMLRWDAEYALQLIQEHKITSMVCVPTLYIDLLHHPKVTQYDLRSLKLCSSGGAKMPVPVMEALQKKLGDDRLRGLRADGDLPGHAYEFSRSHAQGGLDRLAY
jgi:long-chain acyl-CoA synthetase